MNYKVFFSSFCIFAVLHFKVVSISSRHGGSALYDVLAQPAEWISSHLLGLEHMSPPHVAILVVNSIVWAIVVGAICGKISNKITQQKN
ncbi:MAG: hypothetical protein LUD52_04355 [Opitutae bacterium]|nr:hypothetical protein [Opitutae bacterium]